MTSPRLTPKAAHLAKKYEEWHWGAKPNKFIHVRDPLVPDLVGIGDLRQLHVDGQPIDFPAGNRLGFDPKHARHRLYIVLDKATREAFRHAVKYAKNPTSLQAIAQQAGGLHLRAAKLPSIRAVPLGKLTAVVYYTFKAGEDDNAPAEYIHEFGREHSKGIVPMLAVDVSGRLWVCGGSYFCPLAGITG